MTAKSREETTLQMTEENRAVISVGDGSIVKSEKMVKSDVDKPLYLKRI